MVDRIVSRGDRILILASSGTLTVIEATGEAYREVAAIKVAETKTYAHLVVAGSRLYIRDSEQVNGFDFALRGHAKDWGDSQPVAVVHRRRLGCGRSAKRAAHHARVTVIRKGSVDCGAIHRVSPPQKGCSLLSALIRCSGLRWTGGQKT